MRRKKFLCILLSLYIVVVMIYTFRYELMSLVSQFINTDYVLENLTEKQKVEDFEVFYSNMLQSIPYLKNVKEIYGIDFEGRKDYYLSEIKATKDNVEYYGVMEAISRDLASFHTDICFPLYSSLRTIKCYGSEDVVQQFGMEAKMQAWSEEIEQKAKDYENIDLFCVKYVDGKYILKEGWLSEEYKGMANYELVSIDGIEADLYVVENLSIYKLGYDSLFDKPYRENYLLNGGVGREVKVVWRNLEGEEIEQDLFIDKGVEVVASYGHLFLDRYEYYGEVGSQDFFAERDDANQVEYIAINNFDNKKGKELKEYLANMVYDKVVIDLRNNYGGYIEYAQKYLYPELHGDSVTFHMGWKVPDTRQNEKMTTNFILRLSSYEGEDERYKYYDQNLEFTGKADANKTVYYLVGPETGSAAATYAAMIKETGFGIVVGSNMGGEGLGASYICDSLQHSSLVYVYYPSVSTKEGSDNLTVPDVYINHSIEDYGIQEKSKIEGTELLYKQRLSYDTVLKWVIEQ